jgi:prefoldin subunit 5
MNKDVRLKNQRHAELLRRRIEELSQQLAILNSERGRFEKLLDGVRE